MTLVWQPCTAETHVRETLMETPTVASLLGITQSTLMTLMNESTNIATRTATQLDAIAVEHATRRQSYDNGVELNTLLILTIITTVEVVVKELALRNGIKDETPEGGLEEVVLLHVVVRQLHKRQGESSHAAVPCLQPRRARRPGGRTHMFKPAVVRHSLQAPRLP